LEDVMRALFTLLTGAGILAFAGGTHAQNIDWEKVDATFGRKAAVTADVHRYGFPRSDLTVKLDGITLKPALALGGWVAFKPMGDQVMVMGDLVLLDTEVSKVMSALIENGIVITALHNHLLRAEPVPWYMHVGGHGDPLKLAAAIRQALGESKTPLQAAPASGSAPPLELATAQLDQIIGVKGQQNGGVYQFAVPRRDAVEEGDMPMAPPGPLGVATAINFQPTEAGKAATTGDFVLTANEVNPVIKALREHGIEVTAVHSHMLTEQPHLFFMHFWANDDAIKLANGLRAALDQTAVKKM
jgi:hypothetical protein